MPRISVVIPSYCGERFVAETVRSVLDQTFRDFELLVVDDGSTDGTRDILADLAATDARMRVVEKDNEGLIATLNRGIAEARGELIARLDHDDMALPRRLEKQLAFLDANPDYVGCGCLIENIDEAGRSLGKPGTRDRKLVHEPLAFPPKLMWLYGPTPMIRADVLRKVGGYRDAFVAAEDRDLCWRLGAVGRMHMVPEVLVQHRLHAGNMSVKRRRTQIYSAFLADLSAIAVALGEDDAAILAGIVPGGDYEPVLSRYRALINERYPIDTYWLLFLTRYGAWEAGGFSSPAELDAAILRHYRERPFDLRRAKLLQRSLHGRFVKRKADPALERG